MPRSPRYSLAQTSKAKICESRRRGPSAWQACMYSCAMVPSGVTPCFIASQTFEVPAKRSGISRLKVPMTSSCQSREKRRRVP